MSAEIEQEYFNLASKDSIRRLFNRRGVHLSELADVIEETVQVSELVTPEGSPPPCRDPDDQKYLHCAFFAGARWLITRDEDLLQADNPTETAIVRPEEFIASAETLGVQLDP